MKSTSSEKSLAASPSNKRGVAFVARDPIDIELPLRIRSVKVVQKPKKNPSLFTKNVSSVCVLKMATHCPDTGHYLHDTKSYQLSNPTGSLEVDDWRFLKSFINFIIFKIRDVCVEYDVNGDFDRETEALGRVVHETCMVYVEIGRKWGQYRPRRK